MKSSRILQTVILLVIAVSVISCGTSRRTTDRRYPDGEYPSRVPDGRPYPDYPQYPAERYPDYPPGDYPVYNDPNPGNLPPGQAKKIYGGKSAKPYAPGQRKKYGNNNYAYRRTFPLIIIRTRDMMIQRDRYNQYYYRHPDGMVYWKGYDNRYYLDEKYLSGSGYDQQEYDEWKYRGKRY